MFYYFLFCSTFKKEKQNLFWLFRYPYEYMRRWGKIWIKKSAHRKRNVKKCAKRSQIEKSHHTNCVIYQKNQIFFTFRYCECRYILWVTFIFDSSYKDVAFQGTYHLYHHCINVPDCMPIKYNWIETKCCFVILISIKLAILFNLIRLIYYVCFSFSILCQYNNYLIIFLFVLFIFNNSIINHH